MGLPPQIVLDATGALVVSFPDERAGSSPATGKAFLALRER